MKTQNRIDKKVLCLVFALGTSLLLSIPSVRADDPALMGWWKLDGDALDSSGHDRHGALQGSPTFEPGVFGQALEMEANPDYVTIDGYKGILGTHAFSIAAWVKTTNTADGQIMHWGSDVTNGERVEFRIQGNRLRISHGNGNVQGDTDLTGGEWYHVAVTVIDGASASSGDVTFYVNGQDDTQAKTDPDTWHITPNATLDLTIGWRPTNQDRPFIGSIDEVVLYNKVLTPEDVARIMNGDILPASGRASKEDPADQALDVLRDTILTWNAGEFAVTHDVYFGTSFEDVNTATVPTTPGLDANSLDVGVLEFGKTYYWRVDEVNCAPDNTIFKGDVWSFTVEPYSIQIPGSDIIATASSFSNDFSIPEKTLDGSGLGENETHGIKTETMWFTETGDQAPWIQYEFDTVKKLDTMKVWNSNSSAEGFVGYGVKGVLIEYSKDGESWDVFEDVNEFSRATGVPIYNQYDEIALGGLAAKMVRLNIQSNWGGFLQAYSLSEVQFKSIPTFAREPQPEAGDGDVAPDAVLSWRAGREAVSHEIYLGTDSNELSLAKTVGENEASIDSLNYDTTYFWQIVEVNEAEEPASYPGDVWSFTTQAYFVVDDFDSYSNDSPDRPFQTWLDGFGYSADEFFPTDYLGNGTGSGVGHDIWSVSSPQYNGQIMEGTIAKGGQSMPLYFNNTNGLSLSETERTFARAQDWTANGIKSLSLNLYGQPDNSGQLYLKINDTRIDYIGLSDALQRQQWIPWNIDLSEMTGLENVTSLAIGIEDAGAAGLIYVDDVRLYPMTPDTIDPVVPNDSDPNLVALYEFEGNADDSVGDKHATVEGAPLYTQGKSGQAISLDGFIDYAVHTLDAEEIWSATSVSLWARTDMLTQAVNSGLFNNNSAANDFQIDMDGSDPGAYRYNGIGGSGLFGPVTNEWVHLAISCDGTTTNIYYNGLFVTSINVANTQYGQIAVGINRGMAVMFEGEIDAVRVYNRALSNAEIAGLAGLTETVPASF